jgi:CRP/FNR family transcriptional regulator, cyclic AMP receptor protein
MAHKVDMRGCARSAGSTQSFPEKSVIFERGDPCDCVYIVQSGVVELHIGDKLVDVCGENDVIGFMAMLDDTPRTSTALVKENAELTCLNKRTFRYMLEEVPYFALYIMDAMARRLREVEHGM